MNQVEEMREFAALAGLEPEWSACRRTDERDAQNERNRERYGFGGSLAQCPVCGRKIALSVFGKIRWHKNGEHRCEGTSR